ncbi:MAG: MoaD/ThiS family protein [Bryobacteraceae bacterium]
MKVYVPSPLRSYTGGKSEVEAAGLTVREVLLDLDRQFPGIRYRMIDEQDGIRPHIRLFVDLDQAPNLDTPARQDAPVHIICALSGGIGRPAWCVC